MKKVFFHFGPGGHAYLENSFISEKFQLNYFDLSKLKKQPKNFTEMIDLHSQYLIENYDEPVELYAHSFGCDIAFYLASTKPHLFSKLHLISPLQDLFLSLKNLCKKVAEIEKDKKLLSQVEIISKNQTDLTSLWDSLLVAFQKDSFPGLFWSNKKTFNQWIDLQKKAPSFDFSYWKDFLNNYIISDLSIYAKSIQAPCMVYFGSNDPYICEIDIHFWKNKIGSDQFIVLNKTSHSPHLEQSDFFKTE